MIDVTGIDHIYLAVSDLARSADFYDRVLCQVLGFRKQDFQLGDEPHVHYFNRHFSIVLRPARQFVTHDAYAPGLHHLCLQVESVADVAAVAAALADLGASPPQHRPAYAPVYHATFIADPDGIRLEVTNLRAERRARRDHWETLPQ